MEERSKGIEFHDLPKTFQDAVSVTRSLGIRYLWIDSLCILQGDVHDWEVESGRMAEVYGNVHLVIAASMSWSSSSSFIDQHKDGSNIFSTTHLTPCWSTHVGDIKNANGSVSSIYKRNMNPLLMSCSFHNPHRMKASPLNEREWAFQENLLARRIVHFTDGELLWECLECLKCECIQINNSLQAGEMRGITRRSQFVPCATVASGTTNHDLWLGLIMHYSTLKLTHESDRLPALSGLAKKWQSRGD